METLSRWVLTFLLNALWQVALVTLVVAGAARLLRRAPARYRHALWVAALALSVLLPVAGLREPAKFAAPPPRNTQPEPALSPLRADSAQSFAADSPVSMSDSPAMGRKLLNSFPRRKRSIALPPWVAEAALAFYPALLLIQLTRLARAWRRTRQIRGSAQSRALRPESRALLSQCQAALGLCEIAVCASSELAGPVTIGVMCPMIIMPESLFDGPPSEEFASALCHEMAHIRRNDYLLNLICESAVVALAFHPAAWLMKRRIDETRELACDEAASERFLGPAAYARSLVSLANSLGLHSRPGCTLGVFDSNILEERVMKLLNRQPQISSLRARMLFGAATLALALGALTAGAFSVEAGKSLPAEAVVNNEKAGGTLSGTVFDPSGARVPRANVTILDKVNGAKQSTATNESGEFSFTNLPADGWNLTVMKPGFVNSQTTICSCEKMPASLNIVLSPGEVYQTVTVTGAKVKGATPAPAPTAPERIRVGGSIEAAKLIAATHPDYPESVRAKGIQGEVLLEAVISKDGIPISFKVITSPNEALSRSALDAVKTWRYKPTLLNGNPIEVATTIAVNFQLRD